MYRPQHRSSAFILTAGHLEMTEVIGDDWDTPIYAALLAHPDRSSSGVDRQERILRSVIAVAGPHIKAFLSVHGPRLVQFAGSEAVLAFMECLTNYYDTMLAVIENGSAVLLPEWMVAVKDLQGMLADRVDSSIFLCFQLGLPLLCPQLIAQATGRPIAVVVHRRSVAMHDLLRKSIKGCRLLFIEDDLGPQMIRALREGLDVVLNVDTVYPGTRSATMAFLGRQLEVPIGWRVIARRVRRSAVPLCLFSNGPGVNVATAAPIDLSDDQSATCGLRDFFEPLVIDMPLQWLGWGSLS